MTNETTTTATVSNRTMAQVAADIRAADKLGEKAADLVAGAGQWMKSQNWTQESIGKEHKAAFAELVWRSLRLANDKSLTDKEVKVAMSKETDGEQIVCKSHNAKGELVGRSKRWLQMQLDKPRKTLRKALREALGLGAPADNGGSKTDAQKIAERILYLANRTKDEQPLCKDVTRAQQLLAAVAAEFGVSKLVKFD